MNPTIRTIWGHVWPWLAVLGFFAMVGAVGTSVGGL